ncbi:MAG TPA: hypothetical protein VLB68_31305 [Pyrinomonadaceae bacterium]|nr:hypothetical protein [Pyrinomonadaceae bacterium]
MIRVITLIVVLLCINSYASQQQVSISRGYFTGSEYLEMTETERRAYATGAINGMLVAPLLGAPQERVDWLKKCSANLSDTDTAAILTKYINSQPGQLSASLNVITFNALREACPK